MDITNKTTKPISLPLPGGKKLFLGPGKTGQVSPKAIEHPPLAKLIKAGDLETSDGTSKRSGGGADHGSAGAGPGAPRQGSGAMRQSGDR